MVLQAGTTFGNYRIVRLIGEGGFGQVYLAENPLINRRAAIKVLHPSMAADTELLRRFLNEARAASAIHHPNIIEVFDAGGTAEGAPYILMEFLEGESLQACLARVGSLALPRALDIANQAGSALAAAHFAGIVHRDLKPENLFLVSSHEAPGGELVKILDFGIAKIKNSGQAGNTQGTRSGLIMGSPAYMSPEQCKDSADVDLRSDIYSFAIIVYEMLAGRPPHVAATGTELLVLHLTETPLPLRTFAPNVPAYIEAAVMRALARQREDRFQSVGDLLDALNQRTAVADVTPRRFAERPAGASISASAAPTTAPSVTTLSQVAGDVDTDASPVAGRSRRWLALAGAGVVLAGIVGLLLLRPHRSAEPQATPAGAVALTGTVVAPPLVPPAPRPAVLPTVPDAGPAPDASPVKSERMTKVANAPSDEARGRQRMRGSKRSANVPARPVTPPSPAKRSEDNVAGF